MADVEQTFEKFPILPPELRHHVLTYLNNATKLNYSQCSKFCAKDIEHFNRFAPRCIQIRDILDNTKGIEVVLHFKGIVRTARFVDVGKNMYSFFERDDGNYQNIEILDGNPVDSAFIYIDQKLRRLDHGVVEEFEINMRVWSRKIMDLRVIPQVQTFVVKISSLNYPSFIKNMNRRDDVSADFVLLKTEADPKFEVPPTYQRSKFVNHPERMILTFPLAKFVRTRQNRQIDPMCLSYYSDLISEDYINTQLRLWNNYGHNIDFKILIPVLNPKKFDRKDILYGLPIPIIDLNGKTFLSRTDGSRVEFFVSDKRAVFRSVIE